jgi:hypothetical protein
LIRGNQIRLELVNLKAEYSFPIKASRVRAFQVRP